MENVSLKKELTLILKDRISLSESTKTGFAPTYATELAVAT